MNALTFIVLGVVLVPLLVVAVVLVVRFGPHFTAGADNAVNELRIRDIGTHPVLLGPYSRDGWSHPGPALYYALVGFYRIFGSASVGLYLGAVAINAAAAGAVLVLARRFGGTSLLLLMGLGMAVMVHHLGAAFVGDPWNPWVTVLPYGAFLMFCWAAICGSRWSIPIAVAIGSFCIQTHVGYLPMTLPVLVGAVGVTGVRRRRQPDSGPSLRAALLASVAIVVVMWLPPVIQQFSASKGNLGALWDYFREPHQPIQPLYRAYGLVAHAFSPTAGWMRFEAWNSLVVPAGSITTFPVVLIAFGLACAMWLRRGRYAACALSGVLAVAILGQLVAVWRTSGPLAGYRLAWLPLVPIMTAAVTGWLAWLATRARWRVSRRVRSGLVFAIVGATVILSAQNVDAAARLSLERPSFVWGSAFAADVMPKLMSESRSELPRGRGQVVVSATDEFAYWLLPSAVLWLEKHGYDVRVPDMTAPSTSLTLYDDSRLVFGEHRICDQSRIAERLILRTSYGLRPRHESRDGLVAETRFQNIDVKLFRRIGPGLAATISCKKA